ncbi:MAG: hypothetical protein WBP22_05080 [Candidatus Saccharimonas sp.]
MFRKLVSNLAFSPALVGQLGFYAKRLRKEETTRRIGLIFTALALVVQSFAVFSPPEPANAASSQDLVRGGVSNIGQYLSHYDSNTNNIRDMYTAMGITREEIQAAGNNRGTINSKDIPQSFGMNPHFSAAQGERRYDFPLARGGTGTVYYQPLALWDSKPWTIQNGSSYEVFIGQSAKAGWFAIMLNCGNLNLKSPPPTPPCPAGMTGTYPNCSVPPKMCPYPGKTHLLEGDPNCKPTPKCPVPGKTQLDATDPNCKPDPVASCTSLKINKIFDEYQLSAAASTQYGATVKSYVYIIKRDGKTIDTITKSSSGKLTNTASTKQTKQGKYTIELTVKTSVGDRTGTNCVKSFTIPAPKMCPVNPKLLESSPDCQPCPGDTTLWIKDEKCAPQVIYTKTANNTTQDNGDATKTTARAGDRIIYTLNLENAGKAPIEVIPQEILSDVVEYAEIIDPGNGSYNAETKTLTWPKVTLEPKSKQTRIFSVKVLDTIPAIGQGMSNKTSYDCKMDNTFGNTISINVDCPIQKETIEQVVNELPKTGPRENMIFAGVVLAVVAYFYFRARQTKKEIRLIRRDINAGTI